MFTSIEPKETNQNNKIIDILNKLFEYFNKLDENIVNKDQLLFEKLKAIYLIYKNENIKSLYYFNGGKNNTKEKNLEITNKKIKLFLKISQLAKKQNFKSKKEEKLYNKNLKSFYLLIIQFQIFKKYYESINTPNNFKDFKLRKDLHNNSTFDMIKNIEYTMYSKNKYESAKNFNTTRNMNNYDHLDKRREKEIFRKKNVELKEIIKTDNKEAEKILKQIKFSNKVLSNIEEFNFTTKEKDNKIIFQNKKFGNLKLSNKHNEFDLNIFEDHEITKDEKEKNILEIVMKTSLKSFSLNDNPTNINKNYINLYSNIIYNILYKKISKIEDEKTLLELYEDIKYIIVILSYLTRSIILNYKGAELSNINDLEITLNYYKYKNIFDKLLTEDTFSENALISRKELNIILKYGFKNFNNIKEDLEFITNTSYIFKSELIENYQFLLQENNFLKELIYEDTILDAQNLFKVNEDIFNETTPIYNIYNMFLNDILLKYDLFIENNKYNKPIIIFNTSIKDIREITDIINFGIQKNESFDNILEKVLSIIEIPTIKMKSILKQKVQKEKEEKNDDIIDFNFDF